jgi:DNA segregation ATPase FtsK/SpoIIIE, S-DNA-T family
MPATKTRRRGGARSKSKRSNSSAARARKTAPRSKQRTEPGALARGRAAASRQLAGHRHDALAVGLIALGVLCALGLWTDLAGPVGAGLADGLGAAVGRARVAVPVACVVFAVVLLWPRRPSTGDDDADDGENGEATEPPTVRILIGAVLLLVADVGFLHLAYGEPSLDGSIDALRNAGGGVGVVVAGPLTAATGVAGAGVILGAFALLGALLALGLSIGVLATAAVRGVRRGARAARATLDAGDIRAPADPAVAVVASEPEPVPEPVEATVVDEEPPEEREHEPQFEVVLPTITEPDGQISIDLGDDSRARVGDWKLPPPTVLKRGAGGHADRRLVEEGGRILEATLAQHGVDARLIGMTVGPTVTQYALDLGPGVKVNRVTGLSHDIQYAMA